MDDTVCHLALPRRSQVTVSALVPHPALHPLARDARRRLAVEACHSAHAVDGTGDAAAVAATVQQHTRCTGDRVPRTKSPMAVPTRGGAPAAGLNTPKGMFWMGKSLSGDTSMNDTRSVRARLEPSSDVITGIAKL